MARIYYLLGMVAEDRRDWDAALKWFRPSLTIKEQLGDRDGMAVCYRHLGVVAQSRKDLENALVWYQKSLQTSEQVGDLKGTGESYHQLGILAQLRGDWQEALNNLRNAFRIAKHLDNRVSMAATLTQIGALHTLTNNPEVAIRSTLKGLSLLSQIGSPNVRIGLDCLKHQRQMLGNDRFRALLVEHVGEGGAATMEGWLQEQPT